MIVPPPLKKGDSVALFAPARAVKQSELTEAILILESWGLNVKIPNLLFETYHQFAGDSDLRVKQVQSVLDDQEVNAMIAVRGGYGCSKIVDRLDFTEVVKNPKWLIGFSDLTVFLGQMYNLGLCSIHGPVALLLNQDGGSCSAKRLNNLLFSQNPSFELISQKPKFYKEGVAAGDLVGGNLSVLVNQIGTASFPKLKGNILFIEDLDEYIYHIDRMFTQLDRIGAFEQLHGVVIGHMSSMHDNTIPFGGDALKIIDATLSHHKLPYATGFEIGHECTNHSVIVGQKVVLTVSKEKAQLINKSF